MPITTLNGIRLNYNVTGTGPLVVLVMGSGSPGRVWHSYQVPALAKAGFRVATFDNRGIAPSDEGTHAMSISDLAADTAALIEHLDGAPAHVVGTSMGARIVQELALAHPDVVAKVVLMATTGRPNPVEDTFNRARQALYDQGVELPPQYSAAVNALTYLSPRTLEDHDKAQEWLDIFEFTATPRIAAGVRAQLAMDRSHNLLEAYSRITAPTLVIGFADDRMTPPSYGREVAQAIPGARYEEVADCGHYGYLERPDETNRLLIGFLADTGRHRRA
ncbi:alpha/beta hydrolase [Prescottella equi]|uniref:alpha/beta fold hydrolase n=1 Tax=Rhodococcus hoagii TaxID=43767 RepID=UPI000A108E74|nr:alpha/beta fold hydrolase [Prescottella equi]ORJ97515.1 alpha/beta hydrolase [Prescottella equi]